MSGMLQSTDLVASDRFLRTVREATERCNFLTQFA